jgi:hypothetical protein
VANFEEVIFFIQGYGTVYNPSKATLKLTSMQSLALNAKNVVSVVNSSFPAFSNARNAREVAFLPLSKLITRVMNILKSTDSSTQVDESAKTFARKIQGGRAVAKKTEEEKQALLTEGKEVKEISASQMSYDTRLDSFDKFIKLLATVPQYAPNEADLKVTALTTLYNDLKAKNTAVITATIPLSNSRITRDDLMYKPLTGLVDIALDCKMYIKGVFGASSPQYKQISKIKFTRPR